jgi:hypothetical protein
VFFNAVRKEDEEINNCLCIVCIDGIYDSDLLHSCFFWRKTGSSKSCSEGASAEIGLQGSLEGTPQHESTENSHTMVSGITQGSNN